MCTMVKGGGEIAWLAFPSLKRAVQVESGTIHLFQKGGILSECYELVSTSADDWFTEGCPYVIIYVIMHVKDP